MKDLRKRRLLLGVLLIAVFSMMACAKATPTPLATAVPTQEPTSTAVPTWTPVPTWTSVPTMTPTLKAGETPKPTKTPTATPRPTATPTKAATPTPTGVVPSGTITYAEGDIAFPALIPGQAPLIPADKLRLWSVYETAAMYGVDGTVEPVLAESWSWDESFTVLTFKLRKGIQFHGEWGEMTAEDWKWTMDSIMDDDSIHSGIFIARDYLEETRVVDRYTVQFVLSSPNSLFFRAHFMNEEGGAMTVHSKNRADTLGEEKAFTDLSGGTGPFEFVKWVKGDEAILSAVPDHWRKTPEFEQLRVIQISEPSTQVAALETGQVDVILIPPTLAQSIEDKGFNIRSLTSPGYFQVYPAGQHCITEYKGEPVEPRLSYDPTKAWIGDCNDPGSMEDARKVRWAMAMAIDRDAIVEALLGGRGRPMYAADLAGPLADRLFKPRWIIPYDPDGAKQNLADAGWASGFPLTYTIATGRVPLEQEVGESIAPFLQSIGVQVSIELQTYTGFRPKNVARSHNNLWLFPNGAGTRSPAISKLNRNPGGAFNPGFEMLEPLELIAKISGAKSEEEADGYRIQIWDWFNHWMLIIPLVEMDNLFAYDSSKIGEWPLSASFATGLTSWEYAQHPR